MIPGSELTGMACGNHGEHIVSTKVLPKPIKVRRDKSSRINLRVDATVKATLMQAARLQQVKLTDFMLNSSKAAAEVALGDRTRFVLSPEDWREFNKALEAPPRSLEGLRKLFAGTPVFKSA